MVDTYSNAKLFVEGSLKLVADNQNPASGGFHTNSNSLVDIGGSLDITGSFQYGGSAIELVGNRNQTTEKPSKLIVGKSINIIDATFSGSGPEIIELQNSDIETKAINIINIDRKSTGNGPFTLLGLFGNSSKVSAETLTINTVDSDTGFTAIKLDYPDSKLTVDKIVINNLNGKKGSYLNVSSGITSSGSIKSNAIAISNLTATSDDLFGTQIFGLIDQDDGQVYLATLNTDSIEIQKLIGKEKSAVGFSADLATINTKQLIVNNIQTKLDAIGIDLSNLGDQTSLGQITITDVSGGASAVGLQADNVKISNGIKIQQIQGPEGNSAAIFAKPVSETDTGVVITAKPNANNVIDGDLITGFYEHPDTQEITIGKINAEFVGADSSFTGGTITKLEPTAQSGKIDLHFADKAKWTVTKNSTVSSLEMKQGVLAVDVNLTNSAPDGTTQVDVQGKANGTFDVALNITGTPGEGFTKSEDWILQQESGTLTVGNVTYQNGGALAYGVKFFEDGAGPDANGSTTSSGNKGQWHVVLSNDVTNEVDQVLSLGTSLTQAVGMLSETEDLRMRMGDVRHGDMDGLWVRTYARKDSARGSFGNGFEQDVHGFHIGADHVIRTNNNASWLLGGAFHYGKSDIEGAAEAGGGDADIDQYTFKAYATYMKDNGAFADIVLHTGYYDTTLTGKDNTGIGSFKGDYSNWGYGVSAEVGHRFDLSHIANSWYVEPTAQLTWFHAEGKNFKTSTGLEINQGDADFITGRLGATVGKIFALGAADDPMSSYFSVAMKGGMLYQFDGDQTITAHGTDGATVVCADAMDMKGARAYYGITADWKIDDTWRVYGQISSEEGSGYTKDYDASIGVRYSF